MSYQVLARKWRPKSFSEVVGQEHVLRALVNSLDQNRLHHAYLFSGTRGVGKTTIARIIAKCFNCETGVTSKPCGQCNACLAIDQGNCIDLIEVDAASRTKVEDTRDLLAGAQYAPVGARFKIYIIDEVHMLSLHSFNALLKTLEEPPSHVKFLLATTDPQRLPVTVLSRCLQFNLKILPPEQIQRQLNFILEQEKIISEAEALAQLAIAANGSLRDALSLLDQAIAYGQGKITTADVQAMLGTVKHAHIFSLLEALIQKDAAAMLQVVQEMAALAIDFSEALEEVLNVLYQIAITQNIDAELNIEDAALIKKLAANFGKEEIQLYYQIALIGKRDLPLAPTAKIGFEMILLRLLVFKPEDAADIPVVAPTKKNVAVKADEKNILEQLKVSGATQALVKSCTLVSIKDNQVQLVLDSSQAPLLNKKQEERLAAAFSEFFNRPMIVEIALGNGANKSSEGKRDNLTATMENDPKIKAIISTFNATLIPESVEKNKE